MERFVKSPKLTQEDLQLLFDCLVFSISTDVCWNNDQEDRQNLRRELFIKFSSIGWKNSDLLYLFKGSQYEDSISELIEMSGCVNIKSYTSNKKQKDS